MMVEMHTYSCLLSEKLSPSALTVLVEEERKADVGVEEVEVMMERRETGDGGTTDGEVS